MGDFKTLFNESPVAIWEEDFSEAKKYLVSIIAKTELTFSKFFKKHPEELFEIASRIKILDANRAALKLFGAQSKSDLIENYSRIFHEETMEMFIGFIEKVLDEEPSAGGLNTVLQTMSGQKLMLNLSWSVAPGREHDFSQMWLFAVDVTRQANAESALRRSESILSALVDAAPVIAILMDTEGIVITANDYLFKRIGTKDVIGKNMFDYFPPEISDYRRKKLKEVVASGKPIHFLDYRDDRVFDSIVFPVLNDDREVVYVGLFSDDVTEQRKADVALTELKNNYERLTESISIGVFSSTMEGRFIEVNSHIVDMAGYDSKEELMRAPASELYANTSDRDSLIRELREKGFVKNREMLSAKKNGTVYWINMNIMLVRNGEGTPKSLFGTIEDISERKAYEREKANLQDQLMQSQKMEAIGQLAGGVSHEFNNLLSVAMACTNMIQLKTSNSEILKEADTILGIITKTRDLSNQLLAYARKPEIYKQKVNAADLINKACELLRKAYPSEIRIVFEDAPESLFVTIDDNQILQCLINICNNSRDSMPGGGEIKIFLQSVKINKSNADQYGLPGDGEYCRISVRDTGSGIGEKILSKVLDPFFTTKRVGKGTGLGLSITNSIVKQHLGTMKVTSSSGEGTTVNVFLPFDN